MTDINDTSNYTTRINTSLTTAMGTLQPNIISTAGQLIIGNGDGFTTTSTGLTWVGGTTNTLNATNLTTTNLLTTPNLAVSTYATITRELTGVFSGGVDMFELRNNATNNLRFNQTWIGANDMRWQLIQKSNNVDYPVINFRNGKISVGTFSNPAYQLELVGDINITGAYRVNGNILKPSNAVLADTATALATSRNIAGVAFNGTADVVVDYFATNNKPIILQPSTTNLQLVSGYTLSVPGNMAVGTTAIAGNILQVGAGGRLRISNGTTDYTLLGTLDADGATNTSIVISGTTRSTNAGNIQYLATASGGSHIFYTASATTRMTISSSGVNINDDLGVSGNVGIGVAPSATYKVNVNGTLNATSVLVNGSAITGSKWTTGTPTTTIYYNGGNVGIANTTPLGTLHLGDASKANNDGHIIFAKCTSLGSTRICRVGYNNNFEFVIGDTGGGNTLGTWLEQFKVSYVAPANSLVVNGSGYVGIGTTPSYKCHIKCGYENVATGLHLDADDGSNNPNKYALTIWAFVIGAGQVGWRFRTQSLTGGTNTPLEFRQDGTIRFQMDRWHGGSDGSARLYFANSSTTFFRSGNPIGDQFAWRSSLDNTFAYFNNNILYAYLYNLSDRRIKRDIVEINDETALNMLLLVQPTTYYYRDEARNKGNGKVYGFIAQQIKEVIPEAVNITKDIIANIYKTCLVYNKREIYYSIPQDVAINTEVHILDKEIGEKGKRYKIKEIYEDHFVIDEDIDGDDCFVFGYEVNDLNAIDKSYIYTLNVCATQELHRRIEAQKVIIQSQEERIKELELKMVDILKYLSL